MISELEKMEALLPVLVREADRWQSTRINCSQPVVDRLWIQWSSYHVFLQVVHPLDSGEALLYPQPWPAVMRVVRGKCEVGMGSGFGHEPPPISSRVLLREGCVFETLHPDLWHYLLPVGGPAHVVIVAGPLWSPSRDPKPPHGFEPLDSNLCLSMLQDFSQHFPLEGEQWGDEVTRVGGPTPTAGFGILRQPRSFAETRPTSVPTHQPTPELTPFPQDFLSDGEEPDKKDPQSNKKTIMWDQ